MAFRESGPQPTGITLSTQLSDSSNLARLDAANAFTKHQAITNDATGSVALQVTGIANETVPVLKLLPQSGHTGNVIESRAPGDNSVSDFSVSEIGVVTIRRSDAYISLPAIRFNTAGYILGNGTGIIDDRSGGWGLRNAALYILPISTPANPATSEVVEYVKGGRKIIAYNNSGTMAYFSLDLTQAATAAWTNHGSTAP